MAIQGHKCRRCGRPLDKGEGRYLMVVSFIADVDMEFEPYPGDTQVEISRALNELERSTEKECTNQVYQKNVFLICRSCKEELAENPFEYPEGHTQKPVQ